MAPPATAPSPTSAASTRAAGAEARPRVLVVDDEDNLRHLLGLILDRLGFGIVEARDGLEALERLGADPALDVALCDIRMPRMDGLTFLAEVRENHPRVRVVMMSAYGTTDTAVDALGRGASDYVGKPFRPDEIKVALTRILERDRLEAENRRLRAEVRQSMDLEGFLGRSPAARTVMDLVRRVAAFPSTVLITGESGTGKEVLARALHARSPRNERAFVAVNCAAIPRDLLESELFGHERGAFTGAVRAHSGLFEQAHGGSLLLDEIGDMPLSLQSRLLRVLEDRKVRRVGGDWDIEVDVRLIAATAQDLDAAVEQGTFRQDLFFRLNVVRVRVPPLRERREDIPLLVDALVARASNRLGRDVRAVDGDALARLIEAPWPGNVRQLENALERAVLMARDGRVHLQDLPPELLPSSDVGGAAVTAPAPAGPPTGGEPDEDLSIKRRSAALERDLITKALARTGGNRTQAAKLVDLSYKALVYKMKAYDISVES